MRHHFSFLPINKLLFTVTWLLAATLLHAEEFKFTRTEDVIYGRKFGTALTMDVIQPEKPNGCAVVMVVSGGWFSAHEAIRPEFYEPFAKSGYTVFAVVHGSQPKFHIPEIIKDMHRAVRFIRFNAEKYKINRNKIGVTGGSAGGHLSLILGTQGTKGAADAKDPIDRESSAVQAVACFFPPTDFLNYGTEGESALGEGVLKDFKAAFGEVPQEKEAKEKFGKSISPVYSVTSNTAPSLILHGDADKLVPIQQAEVFAKKAKDVGVKTEIVVKPGQAHGWPDWTKDFALFVKWFDEHLRGIK